MWKYVVKYTQIKHGTAVNKEIWHMHKKTIFLLQKTKEECDELIKALSDSAEFEIVGSTTDGITAISMIADKKPSIIITELVLSGYDGLSVIRKTKELGVGTKAVVVTALSSDDAVAKASSAGADYYMVKPISKEILKERLLNLFEQNGLEKTASIHQVSLEEKISKIFINVGIPPHIKGYSFLREGVKMAVDNPEIINNITKQLYPRISEKYKTTPSKVERAIRHAIEVAWNRGRIETINAIFGVRAYVGQEKPTNGEFIALVADKMLLEKA